MNSKCIFLIVNLFLVGCGGGSSGDDPLVVENTQINGSSEESAEVPTILERNDVRGINQLYAFRSDGEYAGILSNCMLIEDWENACTLETLPFISQETNNVTIEDIMSRVVVTHDWMGERFEEFLNRSPSLMVSLFGSVTGIRIGSTIRPSNYWTGTGAVSIDPAYLWQTLQEKQTVAVDEDFRASFGNGLIFWERTSWRIDGGQAGSFNSLQDYSERSAEDLDFYLARLMFHELAHANDYLHKSQVSRLDSSMVPWAALWEIRDARLSTALTIESPLLSDTLLGIAEVKYRGEEATEQHKSMDAYFIGAEMANDGAARMYGYSSTREDFATLFESVLMKERYNANAYVAVVTAPENPNDYYCEDLTVSWGTRNRLADPMVNARALRVMALMLGENRSVEADEWLASVVQESDDMTPGVDWCTNRNARLPAAATGSETNLTPEEIRMAEQELLVSEEKMELQFE